MCASMFRPATREKLKLRMAIDGPSGSGKTKTSLRFAFAIAGAGGKVAVIDTEHRSASKYQGDAPDGIPFNFDVCELEFYAPSTYTQAIQECDRLGYDVLVIDSLSHAWEGVGGALDQVDKAKDKNGGSGNSFTAWKDVTPQHREMVEAILASKCHVIATMRSKMDYVLEEQDKGGRKVMVPKKVGMAPIQRNGVEYEFDIVADMDVDHLLVVSKTRCPAVDGKRVSCPDAGFMAPVIAWLDKGVEPPKFQAAENPQPSATVTLSAPPMQAKVVNDLATEEQVRKLTQYLQVLQMPEEAWKAILWKRKVNHISLLSQAQAGEILEKLRPKVLEKSGGIELPF